RSGVGVGEEVRRQRAQVEAAGDVRGAFGRHRRCDVVGGDAHAWRKSRIANSVWSGVSVIWWWPTGSVTTFTALPAARAVSMSCVAALGLAIWSCAPSRNSSGQLRALAAAS